MENSKIEWCDHTFNPWIGCTKVSEGCAHCYAETLDRNRYSKTLDGASKANPVSHWGVGAPRHLTSDTNWKDPLRWNRLANGAAQRPRVFCASLADWLDNEVPIQWLARLLTLIHDTPCLDWLLLTKRPQNFRKRAEEAHDALGDREDVGEWLRPWIALYDRRSGIRPFFHHPPANIWVGTTTENQARAEERIPLLLQIPAERRFLSVEPMLGPVDLAGMDYITALAGLGHYPFRGVHPEVRSKVLTHGIDWVICGGESGAGARPMDPDWARSLRDQCVAAAVPFFFKQWGGSNKKEAGRLLDGCTWDQIPTMEMTPA